MASGPDFRAQPVEAQLHDAPQSLSLEQLHSLPTAVAVPVADDNIEEGISDGHGNGNSRKRESRKRGRCYEIFEVDSTDDSYCVCQARENVAGGKVCGRRITAQWGATAIWRHLQAFHPHTHAILRDDEASADASATNISPAVVTATDHVSSPAVSSPAVTLASCAQLTCTAEVSYQQMVVALSQAPPSILSAAIEALQQARERQIQGE